uniref:Uncharacterized protein n=1 Tax=uncultured Thiotrichaceae bacterium TaxID=298394 RepID=A0A6S6UAX2_9GAMM|nr:MAG: Unknown protein [uncultured Thiotrichaceae bacterium]
MYGSSTLFAEVAFDIALEQNLLSDRNHLSKTVFSCEQDAQAAFIGFRDKQPACFDLTSTVKRIGKYPGKGRPAAGAEKVVVGYQLIVKVCRNETAIQQARNRKGRFILATNDLDEQRCQTH